MTQRWKMLKYFPLSTYIGSRPSSVASQKSAEWISDDESSLTSFGQLGLLIPLQEFVDFVVHGRQQEVDVGLAVAATFDDVSASSWRHRVHVLVVRQVGVEAVVAAVVQVTGLALKFVSYNLSILLNKCCLLFQTIFLASFFLSLWAWFLILKLCQLYPGLFPISARLCYIHLSRLAF